MVEGRIEKEAPLWLFLQGTNLMTEGSTLLNSLPLQSLPPDTPTLGIKAAACDFGEETVQSIAHNSLLIGFQISTPLTSA